MCLDILSALQRSHANFCAEQTSGLQAVLESSNEQDHADGNGKWPGKKACGDAVGSDSSSFKRSTGWYIV
jgi:hypothetical protein